MSTPIPAERAKTMTLWILTAVLAVAFVLVGGTKLAALDEVARSFRLWGFPAWVMYAVGALEVVAALMMLAPKLSAIGALLLALDMLGATVTFARSGEMSNILLPVTPLVLLLALAYARRGSALELLGRGKKAEGGSAAPA